MPELPEVETTVHQLQTKVLSRTFVGVWTDSGKIIKKPNLELFKEEIKGKKIEKVWRRGKNIIFELSEGLSLLIHQKLTGHLLYVEWRREKGEWVAKGNNALGEKDNMYLHLIFFLDNGKMLALSDLRKFAKVELWEKKELENSDTLKKLGPEPLDKDFNYEKFKEIIGKKKKGKIKQVLMNQEIIAGIGNIYSDEALWRAEVNPFKDVSELEEKELKAIYSSVIEVLKKGIELQGESISDYRQLSGEKGKFDKMRKVYRKEGEKCSRCGTRIKREKIGSRSTYFCPTCQRL